MYICSPELNKLIMMQWSVLFDMWPYSLSCLRASCWAAQPRHQGDALCIPCVRHGRDSAAPGHARPGPVQVPHPLADWSNTLATWLETLNELSCWVAVVCATGRVQVHVAACFLFSP